MSRGRWAAGMKGHEAQVRKLAPSSALFGSVHAPLRVIRLKTGSSIEDRWTGRHCVRHRLPTAMPAPGDAVRGRNATGKAIPGSPVG